MTEPTPGGSRVNPILLALLGGIVVLLAVLWFLSGNRNPDQDKLSNPQVEQTAASDSGKLCSSGATYDLVKRELFRRAAEVRGNNEPAYQQIAAAAVVRVENPVMEGEDSGSGAINCSGTFYLDLPPGVVAAGNRANLSAELDYTVTGGSVALRNADAMIASLASLTRVAQPPAAPATVNPAAPQENVAASVSANVQPGPATTAPGRPSFDCARAGTPGEIAVCSDSGLAALDLNMATQYRRSLASASPLQKQQLQATRDRFLAYRDRCPNRQCMADAYVGRMREIRDIMEGRWQPSR
jgi:hypothetical protein